MSESNTELIVDVWRGDATGGFKTYQVPRYANQSVLDVVTWIQRYCDSSLSYRFACRVGMCGSCAMTVNGRPRWTCRTHVARVEARGRPTLSLAPLDNLPIIKDLVCDLSGFFAKWQRAEGAFVPSKTRFDAVETIPPQSPPRRAADQHIECINCAVCYAACDAVRWQPQYLGPAALNRAWTLHNDTRDAANATRLKAVSGDGGCHGCHSQQGCAEHCPIGLNPSAAIAGLKRASARAALAGQL